MPDPHTIPFKEASGNGHYESKQLPQDRDDFLAALGLPTFAGDVVTASPSSVSGQVATYWETTGHVVKADAHTGLAKLTVGVLDTVPAPIGAVVGTTDVQTLTNKTFDNPVVTGAVSGLDKFDVGLGNVDNTSDANKPISNPAQSALDVKEDKPNKGVANGYAGLDTIGKVPLAQLPDAIIGASRYQGTWNAAINNPTIPPAIPANSGYYYSVSTAGSTNIDGISTWAVGDTIISNGSIWQKIPVANAVQSVNGKQGIVVVNKADVGLGNVDNTSDATKNSAAATLTNKIINGADNTLNVRLNTTDVVGDLPVANLDGGSAASSTTFWRGDGHWVSPAGGGDVQGPGSSTDGGVVLFNGATGKQLKVFSGAAGFGKLTTNGVVSTQAQIQAPDVAPAMITGQTEKAATIDPEDKFLEVDNATGQLRYVRAKWMTGVQPNLVIADTVQGTNPATAVIVPSFKAHPDAIIPSPTAFDDHFDGSSLNAKWTVVAPDALRSVQVGGSNVVLGSQSAANDAVHYVCSMTQNLPNANNFRLSCKLRTYGWPHTVAGGMGYLDVTVKSTTPSVQGLRIRYSGSFASGVGRFVSSQLFTGLNTGTTFATFYKDALPYLRFVWTRATWTLKTYGSMDGVVWTLMYFDVLPATSGLSESILPSQFQLQAGSVNYGQSVSSLDWVKFENF